MKVKLFTTAVAIMTTFLGLSFSVYGSTAGSQESMKTRISYFYQTFSETLALQHRVTMQKAGESRLSKEDMEYLRVLIEHGFRELSNPENEEYIRLIQNALPLSLSEIMSTVIAVAQSGGTTEEKIQDVFFTTDNENCAAFLIPAYVLFAVGLGLLLGGIPVAAFILLDLSVMFISFYIYCLAVF